MPYVSNNGVSIFYRVEPATGGEAQRADIPLVLAHGFMQECQDWEEAGYVELLNQDRDLVLFDARGHGLSDKPHDVADYEMQELVSDLIAVLDALRISYIDFMGYSFGAWVGFGMVKHAPERLRSLSLGGMHPYVRDPYPLDRRIERFNSIRDALAEGGRHADLVPDHVRSQFEGNDIDALISLTTAIRDSEGFEGTLHSLQAPGLIYAGEEDPAWPLAQRCTEGHDNLAFLSLPALGHMDAWRRSDLVLPHVQRFLASVS